MHFLHSRQSQPGGVVRGRKTISGAEASDASEQPRGANSSGKRSPLETRGTSNELLRDQTGWNREPAVNAAETILVVDNYPELCHIAALLLRRCGYRVLTATNVEEAKRIARESDIDLLLTDVETAGTPGNELAAWFRAVRPQTQIVFMSAYPMQLHRLQPCHFVEKPFIHLDALVKEVREVLNHRRAEMPVPAAA